MSISMLQKALKSLLLIVAALFLVTCTQVPPRNLVVLFDASKSFQPHHDTAIELLNAVSERLRGKDHLTLIGFSAEPTLLLSGQRKELGVFTADVLQLYATPPEGEYGTGLGAAILMGLAHLKPVDSGHSNLLLVITDGHDEAVARRPDLNLSEHTIAAIQQQLDCSRPDVVFAGVEPAQQALLRSIFLPTADTSQLRFMLPMQLKTPISASKRILAATTKQGGQ